MSHYAEDSARLQDILGTFHAGASGREQTHSSVLDLILERIACDRVSMWKFDGPGPSLLCFASKAAGGLLDSSDRRLEPAEYGSFFKALIESGTYLATDALADPALAPLRRRYLEPNGVVSLLDAAFLLNNRAYGMVCCEETERIRHWRAADVAAVRAIVTKMALLMWTAPESVLRRTPWLAVRPPPAAPPPSRRR